MATTYEVTLRRARRFEREVRVIVHAVTAQQAARAAERHNPGYRVRRVAAWVNGNWVDAGAWAMEPH
ncbi:hypothetical protein JR065_01380 [Xanthomonas sp. AmX2]|uniref:hypothetical protein n=1 Tax=Xanthomonas sp. TaxID=29446 RepID=UPI0019818FC6|nr:hypothetical protein [Xanthomonas sp.]MBN6148976.1 hypothetical protein [Xanthomonas sp.]